MADAYPIINSFSGGEGSSLLEGRTDNPLFGVLNDTVENFLITPQGPVTNCPGFKYIATTKDSTAVSRLIPFKFSETVTYMLEFGNLYIRFFKNQAVVGAPTEVVTPYTTAQLSGIKFTQSADVLYLVHPSHAPRKLLRFSDTSWRLDVISFFPPPLEPIKTSLSADLTLSNNGIFAATVTVTASAAIFQEGDVGREIQELASAGSGRFLIEGFTDSTHVTGTVFALFNSTAVPDTTWELVNYSSTAIKITTTEKENIIGWGDTTNVTTENEEDVFRAVDLGKYLKAFGGIWLITQLTGLHSPGMIVIKPRSDDLSFPLEETGGDPDGASGTIGNVTRPDIFSVGNFVTIEDGFPSSIAPYEILEIGAGDITVDGISDAAKVNKIIQIVTATRDWTVEESQWSDDKGWPTAIAFHENRLYFAGTASFPDTIWGSAIGDYENFSGGTDAADSVEFTFTSKEINLIVWLESGNSLICGSAGVESRVASTDVENAPITPTDVSVKPQTNFGAADIQPVSVGSEIVFLQRFAQKLRSVSFDSTVNTFISPELSILSEHILKPSITEMAYQKEPYSIIWMRRSDGELVGMTYLKEQESIGFFRRTTGESDTFEPIAVIPGADYEELWAITNRTIGGVTKRFVEVMDRVFIDDRTNDVTDAFFVDAGVKYDGVETQTITGLTHLVGETVKVLANGSDHPNKVVSAAGEVTLNWPSTKAAIGIGYNSTLIANRIDGVNVNGTSQARKKKIPKLNIRFDRSVNALVGLEGTAIADMKRVEFRDNTQVGPNDPTPLFSGDKIDQNMPDGYNTDSKIKIVQDLPLPMTIVAIMPEVDTDV